MDHTRPPPERRLAIGTRGQILPPEMPPAKIVQRVSVCIALDDRAASKRRVRVCRRRSASGVAENSCRFGSHVIGYRDNALLRTLEPVAAPATQLPDGIWTVLGRAVQGTRRCGDWLGSPDQ